MTLSFILLAAAALALTVEDAARSNPKRPRDGPAWIRRFASQPTPDHIGAAFDIELFAACLRAGLGPAGAAAAVATVAHPAARSAWTATAARLGLGVPAARAWEPLRAVPGLEELAGLVVMSQNSGASIVPGCTRLAAALRADAADAATARAERAGVLISLPLALCFLPAFIVLGLVPIVVSLSTQML